MTTETKSWSKSMSEILDSDDDAMDAEVEILRMRNCGERADTAGRTKRRRGVRPRIVIKVRRFGKIVKLS